MLSLATGSIHTTALNVTAIDLRRGFRHCMILMAITIHCSAKKLLFTLVCPCSIYTVLSFYLWFKTVDSYGECDENSRNCLDAQLDHGDACGGINKDSYLELTSSTLFLFVLPSFDLCAKIQFDALFIYVRPYWEQSYGFAFSASVEWVNNIHQWASSINPGILVYSNTFLYCLPILLDIIAQAKNYTPPTNEDVDDMNKLNDYLQTVSFLYVFFILLVSFVYFPLPLTISGIVCNQILW